MALVRPRQRFLFPVRARVRGPEPRSVRRLAWLFGGLIAAKELSLSFGSGAVLIGGLVVAGIGAGRVIWSAVSRILDRRVERLRSAIASIAHARPSEAEHLLGDVHADEHVGDVHRLGDLEVGGEGG